MVRHDTVNDETMVARKRPASEIFRRVARYVGRYPWFAAGTFGCAVLSTLAGLAFPKLTQVLVDRLIAGAEPKWIVGMAGALLVACALRDFFDFLRIQLNNRFEQRVIFDMRSDLYDKLQQLSVRYFDQRATGDLMTRVIEDVNAVERVLIDGIEQGTVALLGLIGVGVMLFHLSPTLAWWAMLPVPLLVGGALVYTLTAHSRYRRVREATSALNALLHDNLQGIRQIKVFGREAMESERFRQRADVVRRATLRVMGAWSVYSPAMNLAAWLGYVLVFWLGGLAVWRGEMTVGTLVGFLGYLGMFYGPIRTLHGLNQMFQAGRAAGERVFDILDAPVEVADRPGARVLGRVRGEVVFDNVSFAYRPDVPVLHQVSFHVRPGETVALVGPTGAGKSTVFHLLARYYDVSGGRILLDGHDIRDVTLASLRAQIGIVSQEPFLFNGTIRENILYGRPDASETELRAAVRAANCEEFIERLPDRFESRVGERGVKLSVGEKQRISIARALLKNPPILMLDEATASVDTATEKLIQQALERLMSGRTCLVIAHRLSTVRHADQILVLQRGRIMERGRHEELLEQGGLYARLCRVQTVGLTIEEQLAAEEV